MVLCGAAKQCGQVGNRCLGPLEYAGHRVGFEKMGQSKQSPRRPLSWFEGLAALQAARLVAWSDQSAEWAHPLRCETFAAHAEELLQ